MTTLKRSVVTTAMGPFVLWERNGKAIQISFDSYEWLGEPEVAECVAETPLGRRLKEGFENGNFALPFDLELVRGEFERKVLVELTRVKTGRSTTYGELARQVGAPNAARAVGSAMRRNPLPLVVPCHRVLPATGEIGAYSAGGPRVKKWLLELERLETA